VKRIEIIGALEAKIKSIRFTVEPVASDIVINVDPQMLSAAVSNLLQNAFKFTWPFGHVLLKTHATEDQVRILVEDQCGGLAPGKEADLFRPFSQHDDNRSGIGLGLTITRQTVESNGGKVSVSNVAGHGCVFTIELPRHVQRIPQ
jgi:signal transduction histidine kinase